MTINKLIIKQIEPSSYQFSEADFDLSKWRSETDSVELTGGRGASQKIIIKGESFVLRHYLRGGLIAHLSRDLYVWTGLIRSRPYLETKAIQRALQHDLSVPEVMAYCVKRMGLYYKASIISRFIDNEGTLASYLYDKQLPDSLWSALGSLIKQLHQASIFHADLNANNILIVDGQFHLIDFDKAEIAPTLANSAEKNVQRLLRSLNKIQMLRRQQNLPFYFAPEQWSFLLQAYK